MYALNVLGGARYGSSACNVLSTYALSTYVLCTCAYQADAQRDNLAPAASRLPPPPAAEQAWRQQPRGPELEAAVLLLLEGLTAKARSRARRALAAPHTKA